MTAKIERFISFSSGRVYQLWKMRTSYVLVISVIASVSVQNVKVGWTSWSGGDSPSAVHVALKIKDDFKI